VVIRALDRKLLRDLRRIWAQTLAIGLVLACGIMVLVLANGTQQSLSETRSAYYERHRFADIFASAIRAPRGLMTEIAALDGVALAEARIGFSAVLDIAEMQEPASGQILSLPAAGAPRLNVPLLRTGRMPDPLRAHEVVLGEPFALAHDLQPGATLRAILNGQLRELTVTGHVLSPEFIYTIGPGALMPDDRRFGLIWMNETAAAAASDLDGAFNEVALGLARGADAAAVIAALDRLLAPYGGTGAHGRDQQMSHAFLQSELDQLAAMAVVLPPIFLVVSAFLVNMVLGRLIALERQQIGLLKAVGYSTRAVSVHYLKLSLGIGVVGILIGWVAGWWLGRQMTVIYAEFFRFPWLIYVPNPGPFIVSGVLGMATVLLGALRAVWASVRLPPAVAMSPPAPPLFRRGWIDTAGRLLRLRQTTMMILRSVTRWPGRAMITVFGVTASVSVLVASFFTFDAMDLMVDEMFYQANRQHVTLLLAGPRTTAAVQDAASLPGVLTAEGAFAVPVRLHHGHLSRLTALQARSPDAALSRLLDDAGRRVELPDNGVVLPQGLAAQLGVGPGDRVRVELLSAPRETWEVPVGAVIRQTIGQDIHMAAPALFALMRQVPQVNQLHLLVDDHDLPALHAQVKATPAIAGLVLWSDVRRQFEETIRENLWVSATIYSVLGMLITIGVIYNAARIQLSERAHELASLRVLGFTRAEVGYVLVGELMLLTLLAVPLGWFAGYGFAALVAAGFSTDIVSLPLVVERRTYALASLIVLVTSLGAALVVRRRLDRIDIVSALKAKE
jgi:putative ABC transport system permease protein